jgi:hypothetical protein
MLEFSWNRFSISRSTRKDPLAQERKRGPPIAPRLDQLESVDMAFYDAIAFGPHQLAF